MNLILCVKCYRYARNKCPSECCTATATATDDVDDDDDDGGRLNCLSNYFFAAFIDRSRCFPIYQNFSVE